MSYRSGEKLDHGLFSPAANEEEQKKKYAVIPSSVLPFLAENARTPSRNAEKQRVFSTFAAPPTNLAKLEEIIAVAREKGFTSVGAVGEFGRATQTPVADGPLLIYRRAALCVKGFCWGAKIVFVSSKLDAKAACHPSCVVPLTSPPSCSLVSARLAHSPFLVSGSSPPRTPPPSTSRRRSTPRRTKTRRSSVPFLPVGRVWELG